MLKLQIAKLETKTWKQSNVGLKICVIFVKTTFVGTIMEVTDKELVVGLLKASANIEEKLNTALKPNDLSVPQFNVLRILRGNRGRPATLATLQAKMIKPMSNTTRLVDKLLSKKLVSREICTSNRRKVDICITQKGLDLLAQLDQTVAMTEKLLLDSVSASQRKQLQAILSTLTQEKK